MLEVECPAVTPEVVLKASGHVERFTDFMVTDLKTGDCYRADHLLENHLEALLEDSKNPLSAEQKKVRGTRCGGGLPACCAVACADAQAVLAGVGEGGDENPACCARCGRGGGGWLAAPLCSSGCRCMCCWSSAGSIGPGTGCLGHLQVYAPVLCCALGYALTAVASC
jgi:hypothetical protein